jgi:hypothetical protein
MKRLQLDFSPRRAHLRNIVGGVTLAACLLAGFWLLMDQRNLNERTSLYQDQSAGRIGLQGVRTPVMSVEERQADEVAHALNIPWNSMLSALEQVQAASSGVHLLAIQPNLTKGEVLLAGEAEDFSILMDYMKALRTKPQFPEVVLVNQRLANDSSQTRLTFTLLVQWKP